MKNNRLQRPFSSVWSSLWLVAETRYLRPRWKHTIVSLLSSRNDSRAFALFILLFRRLNPRASEADQWEGNQSRLKYVSISRPWPGFNVLKYSHSTLLFVDTLSLARKLYMSTMGSPSTSLATKSKNLNIFWSSCLITSPKARISKSERTINLALSSFGWV